MISLHLNLVTADLSPDNTKQKNMCIKYCVTLYSVQQWQRWGQSNLAASHTKTTMSDGLDYQKSSY